MYSFEDKNYMIIDGRSGFKQRIAEAEQHLRQLESLRDRKVAWHPYLQNCKDNELISDRAVVDIETKADIDALNFAIAFITWGMK